MRKSVMNRTILFVESGLSGHRKWYHNALIQSVGEENSILITPSEEDISCRQVVSKNVNLQPRSFRDYYRWLEFIQAVAEKNNVDIIHLLNGDILYRFWGIGLGKFSKFKTIVTYHHIKNDALHDFSVRFIMKKLQTGVIHTSLLKKRFEKLNNIELIDYPHLGKSDLPDSCESKRFFKINPQMFTLVALGGTRLDKGIDLLIKALSGIQEGRVVVLIAGREEYFKKKALEEMNASSCEVVFYLKHLTDDEWTKAISAADCIVLPYRKNFTGASGPLTDAVWFRKKIIGADTESIGDIIKTNHLGYVFECEDVHDLSRIINQAITDDFKVDLYYEHFRDKLSQEYFLGKYQELYRMELRK